jgi:selenocysteine lyase/cysteine desulfurase
MSFEKIRNHFPVANHCLYANTAAIGLMSDLLMEWRQEHDLDYLIGGSQMKMESFQLVSQTKETVGALFGCARENVALVPNFSLGLNMLLEGLEKDKRVLLLETDYPSVNWPFESRGFPLSYARLDQHVEHNIEEQLATGAIDVLAFSVVQWQDGLKIDLDFIKRIRQAYPNLVIMADGTQFCGAFDFDFAASGIDVLGASAYKWLLAGTGNGFMLFSERAKDVFRLKATGFNSVNGNVEAKGPIRFTKHLEPGHLDSLTFGSLDFSLKLLSQWGLKSIEAHNRKLMAKAIHEFGALGLLDDTILTRKEHGTILNIRGNDALYHYLEAENVSCSQRGGGIRLSFHLYNKEADIEAMVQILKGADPSLSTPKK